MSKKEKRWKNKRAHNEGNFQNKKKFQIIVFRSKNQRVRKLEITEPWRDLEARKHPSPLIYHHNVYIFPSYSSHSPFVRSHIKFPPAFCLLASLHGSCKGCLSTWIQLQGTSSTFDICKCRAVSLSWESGTAINLRRGVSKIIFSVSISFTSISVLWI